MESDQFPRYNVLPDDLISLVFKHTIDLTGPGPLGQLRDHQQLGRRYGDDLKWSIDPNGRTRVFVTETADDAYMDEEYAKILAELEAIRLGNKDLTEPSQAE